PAAKQYQEMYDQQLSVTLSRQGGGLGLADVLMRQMAKHKPTAPQDAVPNTVLVPPPATPAPAVSPSDSPFVRSNGQRPLWASRVAVAPGEGGHANDRALLTQRRLSLHNKLTDRLLAGIVPSADPAIATLNAGAVPGRTSPGMEAVLKGGGQPMLSAAGASGRMQVYGRAVAQPPLAPARQAFNSPDT
ncbi:rod-binding protein, partial [Pseudomonas deceptionensis]|uniref:rod-binding protein n=1 Tax=Pseudomonas deceptionensis TaxID=882211 RepID=UPI000653476B